MTKARIRFIRERILKVKDDTAAAMLTECLGVIEQIQSFTRRGLNPEPETLPAKANGELPLAAKVNLKKCARGTIGEMRTFALEQNTPASDGEFLFHHFEGKGWKDVKDWKAHFRKWKTANWLPSQKAQNGGRPVRTEPPGVTL